MRVAIRSLTYQYGSSVPIDYPSWSVSSGGHSVISGSSGCGKTTLLHILGGLLPVTRGEVLVGGEDFSRCGGRFLESFRNKYVGIVFQKPHLIRSLNVLENLSLVPYFRGYKVDRDHLLSIMSQLGIADLWDRKVHEISHGQAQRVAIGRALLNAPQLLLADEPTASLDAHHCDRVIRLLKDVAVRQGATLIIASHDQRIHAEFNNILEL